MRDRIRIFWIDYRLWLVVMIALALCSSDGRDSRIAKATQTNDLPVEVKAKKVDSDTDQLRSFGLSFESDLKLFGLQNAALVDTTDEQHKQICTVCIKPVLRHLSEITFRAPTGEVSLPMTSNWVVMYLETFDTYMAITPARHKGDVRRVICNVKRKANAFEVTGVGTFMLGKEETFDPFPAYANYLRTYYPEHVQK
jgi:hypothetical protein